VRRDTDHRPAPDLVNRRFVADRPDQFWVADMTYVPTWAGFICLSVVLDAWSRRVVGWSIGERMTAELVLAALNMGLEQRRPGTVIHHSDQGCQYTSIAFGNRCTEMGVRPSMGSVGDAYDNATAESFFASLECETARPAHLKEQDRSTARHHLARGLVQPAPAALAARLPLSGQLERKHREAMPIRDELGLPTAPLASGLGGAGGGAVDKPAPLGDAPRSSENARKRSERDAGRDVPLERERVFRAPGPFENRN
jgi:putative transposase